MCIQWQQIVCQFQRILGVRVGTSFFRNKYVFQSAFLIETEEPPFLRFGIEIRIVECRMCTNLEVHFLLPGILYFPHDIDLLLANAIADGETEWERIFLERFFVADKLVADFIVFLGYQCELHVAGKSMLSEDISGAFVSIFILPYASYNREEYWRMAFPECRICLP